MNKKTLGRIAALTLACAAVVPTFGVVASADVKYESSLLDSTNEITGTATLLNWAIGYNTIKHTASYTSDKFSLSYNKSGGSGPESVSNSLNYDNNNNTVAAKSDGAKYYDKAANASVVVSNLNAAVSYNNKGASLNGIFTGGSLTGGTVALKEWQDAWDKFVYNEKQIKAYDDATTKPTTINLYKSYADKDATSYNTIVTNPLQKPDVDFEQKNYFLELKRDDSITMSALKGALNDTVYIDPATGEITDSGSTTAWTIVVSGSTGTTGGTITSATYSTPSSSYRTSSSNVYYSNLTGMYYPNIPALQSVEGYHTNYTPYVPTQAYTSTYCYFNPKSGTYTSSAVDGYSYKVNTSSTTEKAVYKVGSYYYPTYSLAYSAANGDTSKISYQRSYSTTNDYFSNVTGSFYSTYYAALSASNGDSSKVDVLNGASTGYYGYNDPYYYYYLNNGYYYGNSSSSSSNTGSVTMGNRKGWTSIATSLKKKSNGSSVTISMNNEETIPSSVMSAIKGKNVTVKFVLDNGVTYSINGKDVTTAKEVNIDTTYNTKNVSSKLVKAAVKKNDAISSAQVSIDAGTLGCNADVTVKLSSKRADCTAKLYRYNSSKNSLVLVDKATVKSTGKTTFENVTKGGDFVIVICD